MLAILLVVGCLCGIEAGIVGHHPLTIPSYQLAQSPFGLYYESPLTYAWRPQSTLYPFGLYPTYVSPVVQFVAVPRLPEKPGKTEGEKEEEKPSEEKPEDAEKTETEPPSTSEDPKSSEEEAPQSDDSVSVDAAA